MYPVTPLFFFGFALLPAWLFFPPITTSHSNLFSSSLAAPFFFVAFTS